MDCKTARQLLDFARPKGYDLDPADQTALAGHLDVCPDCNCQARAERHVDERLGEAMRAVPMPQGLKERVLEKLRRQREEYWQKALGRGLRWFAAAAAVAAIVWVGFNFYLKQHKPRLDPDHVAETAKGAWWASPRGRDEAMDFFRAQGHPVIAPPDGVFNYDILRNYGVCDLDGHAVPQLLFVRLNDEGGPEHIAQVYILSSKRFDLDAFTADRLEEFKRKNADPAYKHRQVTIMRDTSAHAYVVFHTTDLKQFQNP